MKTRIVASLLVVAFAVAQIGARESQAASENAPFVPGQLIVAMTNGANASEVAADHGATVSSEIAGSRFVLLNVAPGKEGRTARSLNGDRRVGFAEPNWLRQIHAAPDDDGYNLKWDLNNDGSLCDGSDCATADADMDWQEAYDFLGGSVSGSAIVAVIDTGVDTGHPDLDGKIAPGGYDFLDGDADPTDTYGHGTHVAGISLAETDNGASDPDVDTAGVGYSPNIKVMPLRVCDQNGCPTSAIVDAIYHATNNGADVINMSIGGTIRSRAEEVAIKDAWSNGLVIVASSGNDGMNKVSYPAKFKNVIAVGSTDWNDVRAPYSNGGSDLDVVAPGGRMDKYQDKGGIYSTMPTYDVYLTTQFSYRNSYDQLQGTSMAAPQVAGLAALLIAQDPNRSNASVRSIIESTVDDLGAAGFDDGYGHGRVNVCKAVSGTDCDGPPPPPNDAPVVSITSPADGSTFDSGATILFEGTASDAEDGDLTTSLSWTSSIDGNIGTGGSFSTTLSDGDHTITASATDSGGKTGSASISITVGTPPPTPTLSVAVTTDKASYANRETVLITANVTDGTNPVEGAVAQITVTTAKGNRLGCSPTTDSAGEAKCTYKVNAKRDGVGTYTVEATASKDGYDSGSDSTTFEVTD